MKIYSIIFSPTGGTKKLATLAIDEFAGEKEEISLLDRDKDFSRYQFNTEDLCLIAVPSFGGRVPEVAALRLREMQGNGAKAILLCSYGNRAYEDTLIELKSIASTAGFRPFAAIAGVSEHSIMHQFASGRPDNRDISEIKDFAKEINRKIKAEEFSPVVVPGNEKYCEIKLLPFFPEVNENCSRCGICARECPVGAIDPNRLTETQKDHCIACMRCITVCPFAARFVPEEVLAAAATKMQEAFKERKKNELFL
ncbi:MAG TPA: 4Fe-4S binding protein [Candidatus Dorea intestinavium]|nr:4Fe-4S binding protein [Candidatus Dorea intestinavium]